MSNVPVPHLEALGSIAPGLLSDDHFGYAPDEINWGHVGSLVHYAELLKRITDSAFNEGEHAR